jgi:hypothetical protein
MNQSDKGVGDGHDCTQYLAPEIDDAMEGQDGRLRSVLSAHLRGGGVVVDMYCRKCGTPFDVTYEYVEAEAVNK